MAGAGAHHRAELAREVELVGIADLPGDVGDAAVRGQEEFAGAGEPEALHVLGHGEPGDSVEARREVGRAEPRGSGQLGDAERVSEVFAQVALDPVDRRVTDRTTVPLGGELGEQMPGGAGGRGQAGRGLVAGQVVADALDEGCGLHGIGDRGRRLGEVEADGSEQVREVDAGDVQPPDRPRVVLVGVVPVRLTWRDQEHVADPHVVAVLPQLAPSRAGLAEDEDRLSRPRSADPSVPGGMRKVPRVGDQQTGRRRPLQGLLGQGPRQHVEPLTGESVT